MTSIYHTRGAEFAEVSVQFYLPTHVADRLWAQSIRGPEDRCYISEDIRDAVIAWVDKMAPKAIE